jgi:transcriptional regulator with XRE-family HTH domain
MERTVTCSLAGFRAIIKTILKPGGIAVLVSYKVIGRNIRKARVQANLTQEQTAEKLRISQLHFGRLERGDRPASLEQLANIAQALGVPTTDLLSGCIIEESFVAQADESARAFADAMAHISAGVSPEARRLMLALCKTVAEQDRLGGTDA